MARKVVITQDSENVVEASVLAQAIVDISENLRRLLQSGLNRRAVVALVADSSKVSKTTIHIVIDSIEDLAQNYTR